MSTAADTAPATAAAPARYAFGRLYAWSVRRELWENRQIYLAPLAIGGVAVLGSLLSLGRLPHRIALLAAPAPDPKAASSAAFSLFAPYSFSAGAIMVTGFLVSFFYCVGALHGERRDRSVLFWKSLPVSDTVTVLAKATMPLVAVPLATLVLIYAAHAITFALSLLAVAASGADPGLYWAHTGLANGAHIGLPTMWAMTPYGLLVMALWHAPVVGWLLMVSAWARRTPILWVLAPPAAPAILEPIVLGSHHVWDFIVDRLIGAGVVWTRHMDGKHPVARLDQVDFLAIFRLPDIWVGLVFAALFLAAAVWLRRRREPV